MPTHTIFPNYVISAEAIGFPSVVTGVFPVGISSIGAIGSPTLASFGIYTNAIASAEAFDIPRLPIFISGISSGEVVGLVRLPYFPISIPSAEAFGFPIVVGLVVPVGISSSEVFGLITYFLFPPIIRPAGIESGETFGGGLTVNVISNSINYLPVYNQEQDFFKMICDLVDYVRTRDYLQWIYEDEQVILDKVSEVIPTYHDTEAILAYYKFMIKPIIGTRTVLEYITKLLEFDETDIQEWFQYGGNVWHFKVFLGKIAVPIEDFGVTYDTVYNLIIEYKNERSFLEDLHIYIALYTEEPFIGLIPLCGEDVTIYDIEIMVSNIREVSSILSSEVFGSPRFQVMPLGLVSGESIGYPALNGMVPFSIGSGEVFGSVRLPVRPIGFQEEEFGNPRLPVFPSGIISREEVNIFTTISSV